LSGENTLSREEMNYFTCDEKLFRKIKNVRQLIPRRGTEEKFDTTCGELENS
jgi:hypothetical protein